MVPLPPLSIPPRVVARATIHTPPRHVLRGIYRFLKTPALSTKLKTSNSPPTAIQRFLLDRYRQVLLLGTAATTTGRTTTTKNPTSNSTTTTTIPNVTPTSPTSSPLSKTTTSDNDDELMLYRTLAVQYYNLQLDLKERQRLYQLDRGADEQLSVHEVTRRAAARAGLQLPSTSSYAAAAAAGDNHCDNTNEEEEEHNGAVGDAALSTTKKDGTTTS